MKCVLFALSFLVICLSANAQEENISSFASTSDLFLRDSETNIRAFATEPPKNDYCQAPRILTPSIETEQFETSSPTTTFRKLLGNVLGTVINRAAGFGERQGNTCDKQTALTAE